MTDQPTPAATTPRRVRVHHLAEAKERGEKLTMLTAYDYAVARIFDEAGIDLLLVGDSIGNTPVSKPNNVQHIVNIRADGALAMGGDLTANTGDIEGARNVRVKCRHILTPSRRQTVEIMNEELLTLACFPN